MPWRQVLRVGHRHSRTQRPKIKTGLSKRPSWFWFEDDRRRHACDTFTLFEQRCHRFPKAGRETSEGGWHTGQHPQAFPPASKRIRVPVAQEQHLPGKAFQRAAVAAHPVQCAGARRWIFNFRNAATVCSNRAGEAEQRCMPPMTVWMGLLWVI